MNLWPNASHSFSINAWKGESTQNRFLKQARNFLWENCLDYGWENKKIKIGAFHLERRESKPKA
jgi:hypothetical protein